MRSAQLKTDEFTPTEDAAGVTERRRPLRREQLLGRGRIAYAEAQFDRVIYDTDREAVVELQDSMREALGVGIHVQFTGDADSRRSSRGPGADGLFAALLVLLVVFRTFVATLMPIRSPASR